MVSVEQKSFDIVLEESKRIIDWPLGCQSKEQLSQMSSVRLGRWVFFLDWQFWIFTNPQSFFGPSISTWVWTRAFRQDLSQFDASVIEMWSKFRTPLLVNKWLHTLLQGSQWLSQKLENNDPKNFRETTDGRVYIIWILLFLCHWHTFLR